MSDSHDHEDAHDHGHDHGDDHRHEPDGHGDSHETGGTNAHDDHEHHSHDVEHLGYAVVTVSSTRGYEDDPAGDAIESAVEGAGDELSIQSHVGSSDTNAPYANLVGMQMLLMHRHFEDYPLEQVAQESDIYTKTSLMLGVGEYHHEVYRTLGDLSEVGVDVVTFGQYLQPSRSHLDVFEYVHPDAFETWRAVAETEFDFLYCASGPMVRSSYKAGELFVEALLRKGRAPEDARRHARAAGGD